MILSARQSTTSERTPVSSTSLSMSSSSTSSSPCDACFTLAITGIFSSCMGEKRTDLFLSISAATPSSSHFSSTSIASWITPTPLSSIPSFSPRVDESILIPPSATSSSRPSSINFNIKSSTSTSRSSNNLRTSALIFSRLQFCSNSSSSSEYSASSMWASFVSSSSSGST